MNEAVTISAVFLPWSVNLALLVRRIHAFSARSKHVYTKPGFEALFPSCETFIYDWEDVS